MKSEEKQGLTAEPAMLNADEIEDADGGVITIKGRYESASDKSGNRTVANLTVSITGEETRDIIKGVRTSGALIPLVQKL
jgi:hypothetical protein